MTQTVFVTGGAGFIGSNLVRHLLKATDYHIVNIDKLTYAGDIENLNQLPAPERHDFKELDICNGPAVKELFDEYQPRGIFHLAAESHVDRSIDGPAEFIETNVVGTTKLLESAEEYLSNSNQIDRNDFRFLHVSTDEVFGSLGLEGAFSEETPYDPSSPYSASKASADHFVRAWHRTYDLPVLITNCSNNYGPYQFPEKLIPVVILRAKEGMSIPVYGSGENVRDWLHVSDHVAGLHRVFEDGKIGETYLMGGHAERQNIELVKTICRLLDENDRIDHSFEHAELIEYVEDRPGHDFRYAIDPSKIKNQLNWQPQKSFEEGLEETVDWYLDNLDWCRSVLEDYQLERLGLGGET